MRANLERHVARVKAAVAPTRPFGVGLRLSAAAAATLARPRSWRRSALSSTTIGLYVFTINGFPYGPFHGTRVKEEVYLPDWLDEERLAYSDRLAELLATLLPADAGLEGTVSTVPGAFKGRVRDAADEEADGGPDDPARGRAAPPAGAHRPDGVARARARALLPHGDARRDRALLRAPPVRGAGRGRVRPPRRSGARRERGGAPPPSRSLLRRLPHGGRVRGRGGRAWPRSRAPASGSARCR